MECDRTCEACGGAGCKYCNWTGATGPYVTVSITKRDTKKK